MGTGRFDSSTYMSYRSTATLRADGTAKTRDEIFDKKVVDDSFKPLNIKMRESRDSADNPNSNAVIVALDVTGSMGEIPRVLIDGGLGVFIEELYSKQPISDPHLMLQFFDDVDFVGDRSLQATQFEADIRIAKQMKELVLTGAGGGNNYESYHLPLYLAGLHTSIDCWEKRQKKGVIFTVGDELPPAPLTARQVETVFGYRPQFDKMTYREVYDLASRTYEVYHLVVHHGSYGPHQQRAWEDVIGERAIKVTDYNKIPEIMSSILRVNAGEDHDAVAKSWSGSTSVAVRTAITGLTRAADRGASGVATL